MRVCHTSRQRTGQDKISVSPTMMYRPMFAGPFQHPRLLSVFLPLAVLSFLVLCVDESHCWSAVTREGSLDLPRKSFPVQVSHEGASCEIDVFHGETLLDALERTGAADLLAIPSLPSDCRRGNCLTCTGRHQKGSSMEHIFSKTDGLSPVQSGYVREEGYVLTCSSLVTGAGVKLELGACERAWDKVFRQRIEEEAIRAGFEVSATAIPVVCSFLSGTWTLQLSLFIG